MRKLHKGILPPMVTPLINEDSLDDKGLENLVEHLISGGVHGLFILGTSGAGPSLKTTLRTELMKQVCDQVNGQVPVLVGIFDTSFRGAAETTNKAKSFGETVYCDEGYGSGNVISGIKYALKQLNILSDDFVARPLMKVGRDKAENIRQYLYSGLQGDINLR